MRVFIVYVHLTVGCAAGSITYTQMSLSRSFHLTLWRIHTIVALFASLATPLHPLTSHTCAGHCDSLSARQKDNFESFPDLVISWMSVDGILLAVKHIIAVHPRCFEALANKRTIFTTTITQQMLNSWAQRCIFCRKNEFIFIWMHWCRMCWQQMVEIQQQRLIWDVCVGCIDCLLIM